MNGPLGDAGPSLVGELGPAIFSTAFTVLIFS